MHLRKLKRPVAFQHGNMVIILNPHVDQTIIARRKHSERGVVLSGRELLAAVDQVRPPRGWMPQAGETVALLPGRRRYVVASVIDCVGGPLLKIRSRKGTERIVEIHRVVPIGSGPVLVACERIPKDGTTESARTLF